MRRRSFLATPALAGLAVPVAASSSDSRVIATGDGLPLSPEEYASVLQKVSPGVKVDNYSLGGVVETLEAKVAAALGKESAVWLPTGTMANQLAVRILAGEKRRVLVQQECHLYNDCGDCCQTLSNLNLVPLAPGKATFTLEDVQREAERGAGGRVSVPVGAIQIESPVRRKTGEVFDFAEAKKIAAWARANGVGMHLDGARLYLSAAYNGVSAREYAAPFDTVFVSMSKYFNAASGAMLAGPKKLLENLFHSRRMFGGGLPHSWPFAAVAMHYFDGFPERFSQAVATSERVVAALQADKRFAVERVPNGSNIFFLSVKNAEALRERARTAGLTLSAPVKDKFTVQVNETWNRAKSDEIIARFRG